MTIWCKHVHRLEPEKFSNFCVAHLGEYYLWAFSVFWLFWTNLWIVRVQFFMLSYGRCDPWWKKNNSISLTNIFLFNMQCAKIHELVHKCNVSQYLTSEKIDCFTMEHLLEITYPRAILLRNCYIQRNLLINRHELNIKSYQGCTYWGILVVPHQTVWSTQQRQCYLNISNSFDIRRVLILLGRWNIC